MSCNEWKEYALKDLIDIKHGYAFKGKFFSEEETNLILLTPGNFKIGGGFQAKKLKYYSKDGEVPEQYILRENDILVTMTDLSKSGDTLGYPIKVPVLENKILLHNQRLGKVEIKSDKIDKDFLYYLMCSNKYRNEVLASATGTTVKHSAPDRILKFEFGLPSIEEQQKIANILSCLDDKIELNNEMNKTLEEMAQSLFKRWFVDFEFPNEDGEPYKSSGGEMVDSELGMIPKGWEVVNYINTSDIQYGFAFKSKLFNDKEGKPIIRIRDISNSYTPTYTTEEYNDLYIVTKNDILVGMDGEFKAHIWGGKDSLLNQRVLRIRPKDNNSIAYSYFSIKEPLRYLENSKVGTTVIHLGKKDIDNIKIVYPPNNLISKYRDIADNLINKICENKVEIMELSEIRDSLLHKLMSGEIKVN